MLTKVKAATKKTAQALIRAVARAPNRLLFPFCYQLVQTPSIVVIRPWETDRDFLELMREVQGYTLVDPIRCFMLYQFAKQARSIAGHVAEVGVYRGGTARLLSKVFEQSPKTIHLFDTFKGMPQPDPNRDPYREGYLSDTSLEAVNAYLADRRNVAIHPGLFPGTATTVEGDRFAFANIDADIYQSTLDACRFFYPRMNPGGLMMFDDYGNCPGATEAIGEFFAQTPEVPCYLGTGQCVLIRLAT